MDGRLELHPHPEGSSTATGSSSLFGDFSPEALAQVTDRLVRRKSAISFL